MSSLMNKLYHRNQNTVAAPYGSQQLYTQQPLTQGGVMTSEQLALQQQQFQAQTITNQPIVQETIRQDRIVEVQPVIHRDIERPVVNHIERHITEPAPLSRAGNIQHQPIIEERFHERIVNEVQPIIHREIAVPQVEAIQQHYVERVVATPQHTRQVVYEPISAHLGQQYIQNGIGQQQFLQSGLVNASTMQPVQKRGLSGLLHRHSNQQQLAYAPAYGTYGTAGGIPLATNQAFYPSTGLNQGLYTQTGLYGQQPLSTGVYGQQPLLAQQQFGTGLNQGLYQQQPFTDFNRNGIPDQLEQGRRSQPLTDYNRNGIPDQLEQGRRSQPLTDYNRNGIPDQLEGNARPL